MFSNLVLKVSKAVSIGIWNKLLVKIEDLSIENIVDKVHII